MNKFQGPATASEAQLQLDGRSLNAERASDLSNGRLFRLTHLGPAEAEEPAFRRGPGDRLGDPGKPCLERHGVRTAFASSTAEAAFKASRALATISAGVLAPVIAVFTPS